VEEANPLVTVATGKLREWGVGDEVERVYPVGVRQYKDKWYLFLMVGGPMADSVGPRQLVYNIGVLVADRPEGPWEDTGKNPILTRGKQGEWDFEGLFAAGGINFHNGQWILTYANRFGHVGFAVSETDDPTTRWTKAPENPYIEGNEARRAAILIPHDGTWTLLYSALRPDTDLNVGDPRELYIMRYRPPAEPPSGR
jgi:beta-xylosidase